MIHRALFYLLDMTFGKAVRYLSQMDTIDFTPEFFWRVESKKIFDEQGTEIQVNIIKNQ